MHRYMSVVVSLFGAICLLSSCAPPRSSGASESGVQSGDKGGSTLREVAFDPPASELTQLSAQGLCRKHAVKQDCEAAAHKFLGTAMFCGEAAFLHASDVTPSRIAAMFPLMLPKVLDSVVEGLDAGP